MKARSACASWVADGSVRINRQPTDKAHARLRPGDVLTLPIQNGVRVVRVLALATRRGPAPEARLLYEEIGDRDAACVDDESSAYRPHISGPADA